MPFSFVKESVNDQTPEDTLIILGYEIKNVAICCENICNGDTGGYSSMEKTELADTISMMRMFCEQIDIPREQLVYPSVVTHTLDKLMAKIWISYGHILNSYHYTKRFGNPKQHGDIVDHISKFRSFLFEYVSKRDLNWAELKKLGEERYMERMEQLKKQALNSQLKTEYRRNA